MVFGDTVNTYTANFEVMRKWWCIGINNLYVSVDWQYVLFRSGNGKLRFIVIEIRWKNIIGIKFCVA